MKTTLEGQAEYKDMEITKKFNYLTEVGHSLKSSIDTAKKYLESINKYIQGIARLKTPQL